MKNEYIIINKSQIEKRIEELSDYSYATQNVYIEGKNDGELIALKQILSQSTPLIPVLEDAFTKGEIYGEDQDNDDKQEYISNLKLDI